MAGAKAWEVWARPSQLGPLTLTGGQELWPSGVSSRETLLEEMPGGGKCWHEGFLQIWRAIKAG